LIWSIAALPAVFANALGHLLIIINGGQHCQPDVEILYVQTKSVYQFETCPPLFINIERD